MALFTLDPRLQTQTPLPPPPPLNTGGSGNTGFWSGLSNLLNTTFITIVQTLKSPTGVPFSQYAGYGATAYGLNTGVPASSPYYSPQYNALLGSGQWGNLLLVAGVAVIGIALAVAIFKKR